MSILSATGEPDISCGRFTYWIMAQTNSGGQGTNGVADESPNMIVYRKVRQLLFLACTCVCVSVSLRVCNSLASVTSRWAVQWKLLILMARQRYGWFFPVTHQLLLLTCWRMDFFKLSHINQKGSQHYIITLLLECFFHGQICRYISELGEVGEWIGPLLRHLNPSTAPNTTQINEIIICRECSNWLRWGLWSNY